MSNVIKYSNDISAVLSASDVTTLTLNKTDKKLQLAVEELLRMEDEGGTPLTKAQNEKISTYAKARKRIKQVISSKSNTNQE